MAGESDFRKERNSILRGETRLLANTREEIIRLLKVADERIRTILAGQPTDYQRWALPRLQAEIKQALATFGDDAAARMSTAAGKAWDMGGALIEEPLRAGGAVSLGMSVQTLDTTQLVAMRAFATERIKSISLEAANRINSELGLVVIGSQSPSDAIGAVRDILGEATRGRATTIVRTSLGQMFSTAAHDRIQGIAERVPGIQKQWVRSGKRHPRLNHVAIDGQVRDVDQPFVLNGGALKMMYPLDPAAPAGEVINCGCRMVAYKSDWHIDRPRRSVAYHVGQTVRDVLRAA